MKLKKLLKHSINIFGIIILLNQVVFPCTFFMATKDGITFFGNNEDYITSDTNIWFLPAEEGKFGRVYFGFNNGWPQGGMNDQGLCFDGASTPRSNLKFSSDKKPYPGSLIKKIMEECSTVEEVIKIAETYAFDDLSRQGQLLFADKAGGAVIIGGPGKDGKNIDIIRKTGNFMAITNFFPNNRSKGGYPCDRYELATKMLQKDSSPTVENFRSILNAVHVEKSSSRGGATVYSNIFDLNKKEIYIYYFHNFSETVKIKLKDELKKGPHAYKIRSLFPESKLPVKAIRQFDMDKTPWPLSDSIPEFIEFEHKN